MKTLSEQVAEDRGREMAAEYARGFEAGRKDGLAEHERLWLLRETAFAEQMSACKAKLARVEALLEVLTKLPQVPQCQESVGYPEYHEKVWASTLVRVRDEAAAVRAALADSGEKP